MTFAAIVLLLCALVIHDVIRERRRRRDSDEFLRIVRDFNTLCESGNYTAASAKLRALANLIERSGT